MITVDRTECSTNIASPSHLHRHARSRTVLITWIDHSMLLRLPFIHPPSALFGLTRHRRIRRCEKISRPPKDFRAYFGLGTRYQRRAKGKVVPRIELRSPGCPTLQDVMLIRTGSDNRYTIQPVVDGNHIKNKFI
jgi:hypothetical protein